MFSTVRGSAVVAAITGLLLGTAATARAGTIPWAMAPCATVDALEIGSEHYRGYYVLQGRVSQCGPTVADGGFRLATYAADKPTGDAPGYNVRLFGSAAVGAVRPFGAAAVPLTPGEYGVCVLAGQDERIGCYRFVVSGSGVSILPTELSPDAPLVNKAVVTSPYTGALRPPAAIKDGGTDPACGTCF